jgi:2-keto-4-pentenoate hydratase/2-oxohepta-3-ene-1,7-dioic acid hydratase in catechol pathway
MRNRLLLNLFPAILILVAIPLNSAGKVVKYVRYEQSGRIGFGILNGDTIRELKENFLVSTTPTGKTVLFSSVRLLAPVEPSKVIAVGLNYKTHLGERPSAAYPGLFAKLPTSIIGTGESIRFPAGAADVHYEGEMVIVIGKKASNITESEVPQVIFGVTCGNDVSERGWQKGDLQWFRAKASDTFGPLGPAVVTGLDYNDLQVTTRLNGEVRQSQRTKDLIFGVPAIVSYVSRFVTLLPGDVIYTGTPGTTAAMKPGDVVEVEVEGVGILRNPIASPR